MTPDFSGTLPDSGPGIRVQVGLGMRTWKDRVRNGSSPSVTRKKELRPLATTGVAVAAEQWRNSS